MWPLWFPAGPQSNSAATSYKHTAGLHLPDKIPPARQGECRTREEQAGGGTAEAPRIRIPHLSDGELKTRERKASSGSNREARILPNASWNKGSTCRRPPGPGLSPYLTPSPHPHPAPCLTARHLLQLVRSERQDFFLHSLHSKPWAGTSQCPWRCSSTTNSEAVPITAEKTQRHWPDRSLPLSADLSAHYRLQWTGKSHVTRAKRLTPGTCVICKMGTLQD